MDKTSRRESLEAQVASFPAKPGVYLFKDAKGRVVYVGKADVLRDRVRNSSRIQKGKASQNAAGGSAL